MNLNKHNLSIAFFWLVVFISTTKCFAQNFKGGIGDGHASDSIVNVDFNALPENFTVTITLADGQSNLSNNSPINFKATFNKNTSNFISSDVSFGGTANPSTVLVTGGPLVYNIAVSGMTGSGNVNVTIAAGVCTENILGSKNAASINQQNQVEYDILKPDVTISYAAGQLNPCGVSPVNFQVSFTEAITGFDESDIIIGGSANATTAFITGSGPDYNIAVSGMTSDGTVSITINADVCTDLAGNLNTASQNTQNTVDYQASPLTVSINQSISQSDPTNQLPIVFDVQFSRNVSDFTFDDISWSGTASVISGNISGSASSYTVNITDLTEGSLIASIPSNRATDAVLHGNQASASVDSTVVYDKTNPDIEIKLATGQTDPASNSPINFTISFSEQIENFDESDVTISGTANPASTIISGTGPDYNISISGMTNDGTVSINIIAGVCSDLAGNLNNSSNSFQINYLSEETKFEANNIFTPNSTLNRYWIIKNIGQYPDYELVIRNSTGQIVYQTKNYQNDWNGTYKNKPLPTGTYYFFFSDPSKSIVHKGFINIIYE